MTIVITRGGKGAAINSTENDGNLSSLCGINEPQSGTTYTIVAADQNRTIEVSNFAADITLADISTIITDIDTDDFKVTILYVGAGAATITPNVADSLNNGASTIVLDTDDYVTLQTDSTQSVWNIINLNQKTVMVSNNAPLHTTTSTADVSWLGSNSFSQSNTTLVDKKATYAIITVTMALSRTTSTAIEVEIWARIGGSALGETSQTAKYHNYNQRDSSGTVFAKVATEFTVGLDSTGEFEMGWSLGGATLADIAVYLTGYGIN